MSEWNVYRRSLKGANGKRVKLAVALLLRTAACLSARTKTDVVVMINGDRFTCEIKKLERGVLYASFDYADGTVFLQWSKVARVESKQLFIVHMQDGSIYEGMIRTPETPAQQPVRMEVLEPAGKPALLSQSNVVELARLPNRFGGAFPAISIAA